MRRIITIFLLLLAVTLQAQVTNQGKPKSWELKNIQFEQVDPIEMPSFDLKAIQAEDKANEGRKDIPWRYGYEFMVDYNLNNSGNWQTLPDGSRVWRIRFHSEGAKTMNFLFSDFYMPKGANLYLYNNNRTDLLGAYDSKQNNEERVLGTWLVKGEDIWLEYYEPAEVAGQGKLEIFKLVHGYRTSESFAKSTKALNDSGNCNYDVDCYMDGIEPLKEINKKSVALIISGGASFCTGALINNTSNDGTPYFLTANHCYSNPSQWAFRFNWISPNPVCAATANSQSNNDFNQTVSGAVLRARRAATDFCLVEITANLPSNWDLVWAGWDRSDIAPTSTFGIHHPSGDIMKACRDFNSPTKNNSGGEYMWRINDWDVGVTEGGSSGSPLFDNEGRIIGQLYGGFAACNGTNDNGQYDDYGRLGISWAQGTSSSQRLRDWLDPINTGAFTVDYYPPTAIYQYDASVEIVNLNQDECSKNITPSVKINNNGTEQLNTLAITYQLNNNTPVVYNWGGFLNSGQSEVVNLPELTGSAGDNTFIVTVSQPNNNTDEFEENNTAATNFTVNAFPVGNVNFTLLTDGYGSETSWELEEVGGSVLYSGNNYGNNQQYNETFNLTAGCYTFTIFDEANDGICCAWGNGNYSLTTAGNDVIISGGEFENSQSITFYLDPTMAVAGQEFSNILTVYPNPSKGIFNVSVNTAGALNYQMCNMLGQVVTTGKFASGQSQLDISTAANGVYILQVTDNSGKTANIKLVKE